MPMSRRMSLGDPRVRAELLKINAERATIWDLMSAVNSSDDTLIDAIVTSAVAGGRLDIDMVDKDGWTVMHVAACHDDVDTVQQLLDAQASVDLVDRRGCSPLMIAASRGNEDAVTAFLEAGANVNTQDNLGNTALMMAAIKGDAQVVQALLTKGASTMLQDKENLTAVGLSGLYGHVDTTNLLIEAGTEEISSAAQKHRSSIHQLVAAQAASHLADTGEQASESGFRMDEIEAMLAAAPDLSEGMSLTQNMGQMADAIFDRIDVNHDGVIDRSEFKEAMSAGASYRGNSSSREPSMRRDMSIDMSPSPSQREFHRATEMLQSPEPTEDEDPVLAQARRLKAMAAVDLAIAESQ